MSPSPARKSNGWLSRLVVVSVVLAALLATFAVPLAGLPLADGLPLEHPFEILTLSLLICLLAALPAERFPRRSLAAALALSLLVFAAKAYVSRRQTPHGLAGGYWVTLAGGPEKRQGEPPHYERLEPTLQFHNTGGRWAARPFPFDFVHNQYRYRWMGTDWRPRPIFHAVWKGFVRLPESQGPLELSLDTPDGCGLWLDGKPLIPPGRGEAHCSAPRRVSLPGGLFPITVTYRQEVPNLNAPKRDSRLALRWRLPGGKWRTVPARALLPYEAPPEELARDDRVRPLVWAAWLLGFAPLVALALGAAGGLAEGGAWKTPRARWALVSALAALVYFGWTARDFRDPAAQYVWLGVDSSAYESEARAMVREGRLGVPSHGHETKAAYIYYLAAVHALFGGNLFPVVYSQRLMLLAAALGVGGIARRVHGPRAAAYAAGLTLAGTQLIGWSRALNPAIYASGLAAVGMLLLARAREEERCDWSAGAGVLLAASVYARPNFMGLLLLAPLWLAWSSKGRKRRRALLGSCIAGLALVVAAIALRRLALYGQWTSSQGIFSYNLLRGNPVPAGVDLAGIEAWGWANALGVPSTVRPVFAFAVQRPLEFLALWGKKALYQMGINLLPTPWLARRFVYEVFYLNAAALVGGVLVWRRGWPRKAWLPTILVGLNGASLVITQPDLHGFRLVVPSLVLLAVFAGAAAAEWEGAWPLSRGRLAHGIAAAAFLATLPFRYGLQYAALAVAWLAGSMGEGGHRRAALEEVARAVSGLPASPAAGRDGDFE